MRITMAEPKSDRAAKLAFEVNMLAAMLLDFAHCHARNAPNVRAFRTIQFLRLKFLFFKLVLFTVFHASKVRVTTFEAHVVGTLVHGKLFQLVEVRILDIFQSFVFVQTFVLSPLQSFLADLVLNFSG